jgi:hypothetical protein
MRISKSILSITIVALILLAVVAQAQQILTWQQDCNGQIVIDYPTVTCYESGELPTPTSE